MQKTDYLDSLINYTKIAVYWGYFFIFANLKVLSDF